MRIEELRGLGRLEGDAEWVTGVEIDSRRVSPGDLFVALGRGVDFVEDARSHGAAATLVPDNDFAAMAALGRAVRDRSDARVVGITGSNGKTSTKDILAALCRPLADTVAAEEGHNNEIGLPLTLTRIRPETTVVIAEMGMRGLGQIRALCEIARPEIGVITNVGPVHLELLGTVDAVAEAKAEVIRSLPPNGVAVVPAHAPELEPFLPADREVRRFAPPEAELRDGWTHVRWGDREIPFSFTARHQAANAAAALTVVEALGLPLPDGPVEVAFSKWRGEESPLPGGGLLINDAYNANPTSMRAALDHLVACAGRRRTVAVLGDMAELGSEAPRYHEEIGGYAADLGIGVVVGVGDLARAYGGSATGDAAAAVDLVRRLLQPGDVVLVKGSRAVGLEIVADALAGARTG